MENQRKLFLKNAFTGWYAYAIFNMIFGIMYICSTIIMGSSADFLLSVSIILFAIIYILGLTTSFGIGCLNLKNLGDLKLNILSVVSLRLIELVILTLIFFSEEAALVFVNFSISVLDLFLVEADMLEIQLNELPYIYYIFSIIPYGFMLLGMYVSNKRREK